MFVYNTDAHLNHSLLGCEGAAVLAERLSRYLLLYHTQSEALFSPGSSRLTLPNRLLVNHSGLRMGGNKSILSVSSRSNLLNSENWLLKGYAGR